MSKIKSELKMLLNENVQKQKTYEKLLSALPKGSLVAKKINGKQYYYLAYREGKKVKYNYMGKLGENDIRKHRTNSVLRRKVKRKINDTGRKIGVLKEALKISGIKRG